MKILLVEDEVHLAEALTQILRNNGFEVDWAADGKNGLRRALLDQYDLVLLDIMLPQISGLKVLQRIRQSDQTTPIFLLTAKGEVSDKVLGFEYGADDYVSKPFNTDELLARIRSKLRKSQELIDGGTIKYGDLVLDKSSLVLSSPKESTKLSKKESILVDYLFKNNSIVVPFEKIKEKIAIDQKEQSEENMQGYMAILSNKLIDLASSVEILTIPGLGYKLVCSEDYDLWHEKPRRKIM